MNVNEFVTKQHNVACKLAREFKAEDFKVQYTERFYVASDPKVPVPKRLIKNSRVEFIRSTGSNDKNRIEVQVILILPGDNPAKRKQIVNRAEKLLKTNFEVRYGKDFVVLVYEKNPSVLTK